MKGRTLFGICKEEFKNKALALSRSGNRRKSSRTQHLRRLTSKLTANSPGTIARFLYFLSVSSHDLPSDQSLGSTALG
ncbi:hypothetical protein VNO77_26698 [Canavalia gladiata]|uniref:Uncharacterized protein n=1 Tax=Canavalia gladiata TaxID=3824 RepID=A0AAN9KVU3_CANGL